MKAEDVIDRLEEYLVDHPVLGIAVSGGVDSMTLAAAVGRLRSGVSVFHAVSPAVPRQATVRVKELAQSENWRLEVLDAGEFRDADYLRNPVNRCYFCKSNLYNRMRDATDSVLASGANLDDLDDYRPGLVAAKEQGVVHPFIEIGASKADIRRLAKHLELKDIAVLPAQPCLSSRIETGIRIDSTDLMFVEKVEHLAASSLGRANIRCRITKGGVVLEADVAVPADLASRIEHECVRDNRVFLGVSNYQRGSAFLHATP